MPNAVEIEHKLKRRLNREMQTSLRRLQALARHRPYASSGLVRKKCHRRMSPSALRPCKNDSSRDKAVADHLGTLF